MANTVKQVRDYVADQIKEEAGREHDRGNYCKGALLRCDEWKVRHGGQRHPSDARRTS